MISLSGRRAVVTGGTRGIGAAVATKLAKAGAEVLVIGVSENSTVPDGIRLERVDLGDLEEVASLAKRLQQWQVDILINNAGINVVAEFSDIEASDFEVDGKITVHRIKVPSHQSGMLTQSHSFAVYAVRAYRLCREINPDFLIGTTGRLMTGVLTGLTAFRLRKRYFIRSPKLL